MNQQLVSEPNSYVFSPRELVQLAIRAGIYTDACEDRFGFELADITGAPSKPEQPDLAALFSPEELERLSSFKAAVDNVLVGE